MIVLDASIVITALPTSTSELGFSLYRPLLGQNAYALTFGGLLLLGARAGDILGRRRMFSSARTLHVASLVGGARAVPSCCSSPARSQGVGAAFAAPSALALLMTLRGGSRAHRAPSPLRTSRAAAGSASCRRHAHRLGSWRWGSSSTCRSASR